MVRRFVLLIALLPAACRAQSTVAELAQQGAAALNARDAGGFARLAESGIDLSWMRNATSAPDPAKRKWVAGALDWNGSPWVVFSLDKMVEMDHDHIFRAGRRGGVWRLAASVNEAEPGRHWRITNHSLRIGIIPDQRMAGGQDVFTVKSVGAGRYPLVFDLGHEYAIELIHCSSVVSGRVNVPFVRAGNLVMVNADVRSGDWIMVNYSRRFTAPPSFLSNVTATDALLYADWLPVISYRPAPSRISITTPDAWNSIAQGHLVSTRKTSQGYTERTYVNKAPVSFIMVAAGKYAVRYRVSGGIPFATWMLGFNAEKSERGLDTLAGTFPFYRSRFGPIPWKHYTLVETSALKGLAQEGYSFSVYSTASFPGSAAHELGHSWWGGLVNNTYFGSYWNESLTTYSTDLLGERYGGALAAQSNRLAEMRHYSMAAVIRHDLSLMKASTEPWGLVTVGTTYNKGAMVCHMLRRELGDAAFYRTLRAFAASYAGQAVEWDQLAQTAGRVARRPMGWFFDQWTHRTGGLRLRWENVGATPLAGGRTAVRATLVQDGQPFRAHVVVALQSAGRTTEQRVWVTSARTQVWLVASGRPARLVADPRDDLLRQCSADEMPADSDVLYQGHHRLLIVYGTGGPARYSAVLRAQAAEQQQYWGELNDGVMADLSEISVLPDTELTDAQRRDANLIVIGTPATNRIMRLAERSLPARYFRSGISLGGRMYHGTGLVAITNTRSPWNPNRLLTTWGASDIAAMSLPRDVSSNGIYGGGFGPVHTAFIVRNGRLLGWTDEGITDSRAYAFPSVRRK